MPKIGWRKKGVKRLNLELSVALWDALKVEADRLGLKPSHVIRMWLTERVRGGDDGQTFDVESLGEPGETS
ncbi:MAG: hypothetical protein ABIE42_10230 [Candidatus Eisenbacteria bacterium]